jgi:hypothetical protein
MFRIEQLAREGRVVLPYPVWLDVVDALAELGRPGSGYVVLCGSDGSHLQIAGSEQRLTVEYRQTIGKRYRHFVLGKSPPDYRAAQIDTTVAPIPVRRSEVLECRRVEDICRHFFDEGAVPPECALREMTHQPRESEDPELPDAEPQLG